MKQKKGWKRIIKNTKGKKVKDRESVEGTTQSSRSSGMGDTRDDDDNGDGNDYDAEVEINIELADKCFTRNEFHEAVDLYVKAKKCIESNGVTCDQSLGDINVKVSNILQGQGKLSEAMEFLIEAKDVYSQCLQQTKDTTDQTLGAKLVETVTGIANIYVAQREIEKASDTYQEAIKTSRELFDSEEKVAEILLNYGNFLCICKQDYVGAIERLKEVLKIQLKSSNGAIHPNSASTLNYMGKIYMRKSKASNSKEGTKDAERAEACFLRALQLLRFSMVPNSNEKVVDTLCFLNAARERQTSKMGILRNVRFDAPPINNEELKIDTSSSDSEETSGSCSEDISKLSTYSDLSRDDRRAYQHDSGFASFFSCVPIDVNEVQYSIDEDSEFNLRERLCE